MRGRGGRSKEGRKEGGDRGEEDVFRKGVRKTRWNIKREMRRSKGLNLGREKEADEMR